MIRSPSISVSKQNASRPGTSEAAPPSTDQIVVAMSSPGRPGFEKRTASRLSRSGSPSQHSWTTATEFIAIVQSPWMMIPGSPTDFAKSTSVWIGIGSPEAGA